MINNIPEYYDFEISGYLVTCEIDYDDPDVHYYRVGVDSIIFKQNEHNIIEEIKKTIKKTIGPGKFKPALLYDKEFIPTHYPHGFHVLGNYAYIDYYPEKILVDPFKKLKDLDLGSWVITWDKFEGLKGHGWRLIDRVELEGFDLSRSMDPSFIPDIIDRALDIINMSKHVDGGDI